MKKQIKKRKEEDSRLKKLNEKVSKGDIIARAIVISLFFLLPLRLSQIIPYDISVTLIRLTIIFVYAVAGLGFVLIINYFNFRYDRLNRAFIAFFNLLKRTVTYQVFLILLGYLNTYIYGFKEIGIKEPIGVITTLNAIGVVYTVFILLAYLIYRMSKMPFSWKLQDYVKVK